MRRVISHYGASCLGPCFNRGELSWGELLGVPWRRSFAITLP